MSEQPEAVTTIRIGSIPSDYYVEYTRGEYSVYRKVRKNHAGTTSFVIAKKPKGDERPSSVLREFNGKAEAITALDRYSEAPVDTVILKPQGPFGRRCPKPKRSKSVQGDFIKEPEER